MEDSLWSDCPELRRKRIPGTGRSNHERTIGSAGSRSRYDKIYAACWAQSFISANIAQIR